MDEQNNQPVPQPTMPEAQPEQPAVASRFCPACGAAASEAAAFCVSCGASLAVATQPVTEQPAVEPAVEQPVAEPVMEQPAVEPVAEPVMQPVEQPMVESAAQPQQPFAAPAAAPEMPQQPYGAQPQQPMPGAPVAAPDGGYQYQPVQQQKPGGTAALVCGILAIICGFISPIIGVILGIVAIMQAKKWMGVSKAKIGKICGIVGIVVSAVMFVLGLVVGFGALAFLDDDSSSSSVESVVSDSSSSSSSTSAASSDEAYVEDLVSERFDALANGDEALMNEIATMADAGFLEATDLTMSECGIEPLGYADAITDGLSYEVGIAILDEDEGTGWVGVYVDCKDIFGILAIYSEKLDEFEASGEASSMTEQQVKEKIGDLFAEVVNEAEVVDECNYAIIDVVYENGEWVIDEDSWEFELDYMFNVI